MGILSKIERCRSSLLSLSLSRSLCHPLSYALNFPFVVQKKQLFLERIKWNFESMSPFRVLKKISRHHDSPSSSPYTQSFS